MTKYQPYSAFELVLSDQSFAVLALRVDFQTDDNELTSGDGRFDFSTGSGVIIDPPPHDRQYFLDHLEAIKRYYARVSNGIVNISYDLFPSGDRAAYTLPNKIEYYNPDTSDEDLDQRLSELLRDAVIEADTDPEIDFSQYNALLIFHAGVGSDFALEEPVLNPTPHDIPSVFLNLNDLRATIGNNAADYPGIPVDGGGVHVTGAVILPETESKRGVEIGLNGMAAHQFGHYLGLPSLFNTETGRPAIGKWGLMGVGFGNVDGVVPAEPCAWSKIFLGWEMPVEIITGTDVTVVPSQAPAGTKIYKIPLSPTEYFLIENRQQDFMGDGLTVTKGASGVVLEVDDYDVDIPGSGLLIWHIDDGVVAAGIAGNAVNTDPALRGVDLEEADGSQDIGEPFPGLLPGFASPENGIGIDAFYAGNNSEFTPSTTPSSFSNHRANSHISITSISEKSNTMSFSVTRDHFIEGFPKYLGGDFAGMAPIWVDPASPDSLKLVIPSRDGSIFALNGRNLPFFQNGSTTILHDLFGNSFTVSVPLFTNTGRQLAAMPAIRLSSSAPEDLNNKLVIATDEPGMQVYSLHDADNDRFGDLIAEWVLPSQVTSQIMLSQWIILGGNNGIVRYYTADGSLSHSASANTSRITGLTGAGGLTIFSTTDDGDYLSFQGSVLNQSGFLGFIHPYSPLFSDFNADALNEFVALGPEGDLFVHTEPPVTRNFGVSFDFSPVAGDVNGDGSREVIAVSGSSIYALTHTGVVLSGFPVDISTRGYNGVITTEPVLGDITGDGKQNILFGTAEGIVIALDDRGTIVPGFPFPLGQRVVGSLTLLKNTESDMMELAALDEAGYLYLWDLKQSYGNKTIAWGTYGGGNAHLRHNEESLSQVSVPPTTRLMPKERVFNWPNPNEGNWTNIRYFLYHPAEIKIRIFTQVGDLVAELDGPGVPQVDNEVTWDLTDIDSGVYFAEVSASGNGLREKKVIKIAVIK